MTPIYWDLSAFEDFVIAEFNRRENLRRNFEFDATPDRANSLHPATAWIRVCSNTKLAHTTNGQPKDGFVMGGMDMEGFDRSFGFGAYTGKNVIGTTATGNQHAIESSKFQSKGPPGIKSMESELSGGDGKFRITNLNWQCTSIEQLEYMTPYFLTAGATVSIEFGWPSKMDFSNILPISDVTKLREYLTDSSKLEGLMRKNNGNYDVSFGIITGGNYKLRTDGGYDCTTVCKIVGGLFSGLSTQMKAGTKGDNTKVESQELKTYIQSTFPNLPSIANVARKKDKKLIECQVFSHRDPKLKIYDKDFDKIPGKNWWISFGYFIKIINDQIISKNKHSNTKIFEFDINDRLITGSPNLKSSSGNVLLIPNELCPNISFENLSSVNVVANPNITTSTALDDANAILNNLKTQYSTSKTKVSVERFDLNSIINWWSDDRSVKSFPVTSAVNAREAKYVSGYLKNLYVNKNVIVDSVKRHNTYKDIIMDVLNQMSGAAGGIWQFEIVPTNPINNSPLTIIDTNYINFVGDRKIYNFKLNTEKSQVINLEWDVKLTDSIATQTLFQATNIDTGVSNATNLPIALLKSDRLLEVFVPATVAKPPVVDDVKIKTFNKRLEMKENTPTFFYYTTNRTVALVEPVQEIQKELIYGGEKNQLRFFAVQPGIKLELTTLGIAGLRHLNGFEVNGLPKPYGDTCIFQIQNVKHVLTNGIWKTSITANVRLNPLKSF